MVFHKYFSFFFFFNDTATTEIYTLSLHDALPISAKVTHSPNPGGFAGRGVPDLAGNADPATGYRIRVDGQLALFGGTSAGSPLVAGLIARINQRAGRSVGYLNPLFYEAPRTEDFRDASPGMSGPLDAS